MGSEMCIRDSSYYIPLTDSKFLSDESARTPGCTDVELKKFNVKTTHTLLRCRGMVHLVPGLYEYIIKCSWSTAAAVLAIVRWASTGKKLTDRLPKLSLTTTNCSIRSTKYSV